MDPKSVDPVLFVFSGLIRSIKFVYSFGILSSASGLSLWVGGCVVEGVRCMHFFGVEEIVGPLFAALSTCLCFSNLLLSFRTSVALKGLWIPALQPCQLCFLSQSVLALSRHLEITVLKRLKQAI